MEGPLPKKMLVHVPGLFISILCRMSLKADAELLSCKEKAKHVNDLSVGKFRKDSITVYE